MSTAVLFITAKIGKQPRCPWMNEWVKLWRVCVCVCVCTHIMDYCSVMQ